MTPEQYLQAGQSLYDQGYATDGCSFIGWLMNRKYKRACWSHDYGRRHYIHDIRDQAENDNMFRNALRYLGMPKWQSNMIYWFTRAQGWAQENLNMNAMAFVGFILFLTLVGVSFYFGVIKYDNP